MRSKPIRKNANKERIFTQRQNIQDFDAEKTVKSKNGGKISQTKPVKPVNEKPVDANIYGQLVEKRAYDLYEKRGRQPGHELDDWLEAQEIVEAEMIGMG